MSGSGPARNGPEDQEPLSELFGTVFDLADQIASGISPGEVEERLRRITREAAQPVTRAGEETGPDEGPPSRLLASAGGSEPGISHGRGVYRGHAAMPGTKRRATAACPFCFSKIDTSRLAYQCSSSRCRFTFIPENPRAVPHCPACGAEAHRRACPQCRTALPIDFVGFKGPMIGLVGAEGSGRTVMTTVLVKQLTTAATRFNADIRIVTDNPDGQQGVAAYRRQREMPLYGGHHLPMKTERFGQPQDTAPVVLRWRQATERRLGGLRLRSATLALIDQRGEDLADDEPARTRDYLSACDGLIITVDPFSFPGARARLDLPDEAPRGSDYSALEVLARVTEALRLTHGARRQRKIDIPVAIVVTKMDAFYPILDRHSPLMRTPAGLPAYDEADGQKVHEQMLALLTEWGEASIARHVDQIYSNYRFFGVSALGAEPDYGNGMISARGVMPHRVEDPVLWLLAKAGTVPSV